MNETDSDLEAGRNARARSAALAAAGELTVNPTGTVRYHSRGRLAVIGGEQAQWFANRVEAPLQALIVLTEGEEEPGAPTVPVGHRPMRVDGWLGHFEITLGEAGKPNHEVVKVDMVLDLGKQPSIERPLPPPGYWHSSTEPAALDALMLSLGNMVGTFEKPRFFDYDPAICAHARAGQTGCTRCIQACPAEAIVSIGERIEVNPNLCQGGGICASVCPTGAMRYAYPGPADTLERVRVLLNHYLAAGGTEPTVLFAAEEDAAALQALPPNVFLVVVEELASVGLEAWFSALAWGARRVALFDVTTLPDGVRRALEGQIAVAEALLAGLGLPVGALQRVDERRLALAAEPVMPPLEAAGFAALDDKRRQLLFALDYLGARTEAHAEVIPLPPGALFGQVRVDPGRCTLCMSCTSVCPAKALNAGGDTPRLLFHEINCVQCGICSNACPERAITLESRFLTGAEQRRTPRVLHEEPPFCCISCGKPFATRQVIDTILGKLAGHAMFQNERATRRLQMCDDCRAVDAIQDPDAMGEGLSAVRPPLTKRN